MIFDTHLHLIDRSRLSYPWLAGLPPLDRDWDFESYLATAARVGITDVLHMEVDVAEADIDRETAWVAELMARTGSPLRGAISAARPEIRRVRGLAGAVDRQVVRGVRRVLHVVPDEVSHAELFRRNLRRLGQAGFAVRHLHAAAPVGPGPCAGGCLPDTVFCSGSLWRAAIAGGDFDDWAAAITRLAERPNVNAKLSVISAYGPPTGRCRRCAPMQTT